ncbi:MAG: DUF3365 domain-containing protein [Pirellulaceae bacterium]
MKRIAVIFLLAIGCSVATLWSTLADEPGVTSSQEPQDNATKIDAPTSVIEARSRARLLHEMVRGTLQVMHRDFFDEDDANAIPSASLEDVFHEMSLSYDVEMKWLIINTDVVNIDHQAKSPFEKAAVKSLGAGDEYTESVGSDRYRYAGPIRLGSQCLKCHVKRRNSNEDRTAGLIITMPIIAQSHQQSVAPVPTDRP